MNYELVDTILYTGEEGTESITMLINHEDNSMWATQKTIAELFKVTKSTISRHLKNIFEDGELDSNSVVAKFATTASEEKSIIPIFIILMPLSLSDIVLTQNRQHTSADGLLGFLKSI